MPSEHASGNPADQETARKNQSLAWSNIMQLSAQLVQLAQQRNWDVLTQQHTVRDQLLEDFFAQALDSTLVDTVRADIQKIIAQDALIVQTAQNHQNELGEEAQRLKGLRKRAQGYLSAGG